MSFFFYCIFWSICQRWMENVWVWMHVPKAFLWREQFMERLLLCSLLLGSLLKLNQLIFDPNISLHHILAFLCFFFFPISQDNAHKENWADLVVLSLDWKQPASANQIHQFTHIGSTNTVVSALQKLSQSHTDMAW